MVDWGDGSGMENVSGTASHTYTESGVFQVHITGDLQTIVFYDIPNGEPINGDQAKLLSIDQWGSIKWTSLAGSFVNASNLQLKAGDSPDLSLVEDMSLAFFGNRNLNSDVSSWDVSKVRSMIGTFSGAVSFDQDLGEWNITNVEEMNAIFVNCGISTLNYDSTLIKWARQEVQDDVVVDALGVFYCGAETARQILIDSFGWKFNGDVRRCPFITTWDTRKSGTTDNRTITIKTLGEGYSYNVDWTNDGIYDTTFVKGTIRHTYDEPGQYSVAISGIFPRIDLYNNGDRLKLISIDQWGDIEWKSMRQAFEGAANMVCPASDAPILDEVTNMFGMFSGCTSFTGDLSAWDVSSVTNMFGAFIGCENFNSDLSAWDVSRVLTMNQMFRWCTNFNSDLSDWDVGRVNDMNFMFAEARSFDQNLGNWDIQYVYDMSYMLNQCGMSVQNYDHTLIEWAKQDPISRRLGADDLLYCIAQEARDSLIEIHGWRIDGDGRFCNVAIGSPFVTSWKTDNTGESDDRTIVIPTFGKGYDYSVDWGDGIVEDGFNGSASHTYDTAGMYSIAITGVFPRIFCDYSGDVQKLVSIDQWGDNEWSSMRQAFAGATNVVCLATDTPDLSGVSDLFGMFSGCTSLTGNFSHWDVSHVQNFFGTFRGCEVLESDLSGWNVRRANTLNQMFSHALIFDSDLSNWAVNKVTDFAYMFIGAESFSANLESWQDRLDNATNMEYMFYGASSYNHSLGNWNVRSVQNMANMLAYSGLSLENYEATLEGWLTKGGWWKNLSDASEMQYCDGKVRSQLINERNWTIFGDSGPVEFEIVPGDPVRYGNDATATLDIKNGTGPFEILLDGMSSDTNFTGLSAGEHQVQITDGNGCIEFATFSPEVITTICDFPGDFISNGVGFNDSLENVNALTVPTSLISAQCVIDATDFEGHPSMLYKSYVYQPIEDSLVIEFKTADPERVRAFIYTCRQFPEYSVDSCIAGTSNASLSTLKIPVEEPYYFIVVAGWSGEKYSLKVGEMAIDICNYIDRNIKFCQSLEDSLSSTSRLGIDLSGDLDHPYQRCYSGSRMFNGGERVYAMQIDTAVDVTIDLEGDPGLSVFLFNFDCKQGCLEFYSEANLNSTDTVSLNAGYYYLVVESESHVSEREFRLSVTCIQQQEVAWPSRSSTDCPNQGESIHMIEFAEGFLDPVRNLLLDGTNVLLYMLTPDRRYSIGEAIKLQDGMNFIDAFGRSAEDQDRCGYIEGEDLTFAIKQRGHTTIFCTASFEGGDNGKFRPSGQSKVLSLSSSDIFNVEIVPQQQTLGCCAQDATVRIKGNQSFELKGVDTISWIGEPDVKVGTGGELEIGTTEIRIPIDPNNTSGDRTARIRLEFGDSIPRILRIDQIGCDTVCTLSQQMPDHTSSKSFTIYPNPASSEVQVRYEGANTIDDVHVRISSVGGKVLQNIKIESWLPHENQSLAIETLSPGLYFVQINGKSLHEAYRIIKAR